MFQRRIHRARQINHRQNSKEILIQQALSAWDNTIAAAEKIVTADTTSHEALKRQAATLKIYHNSPELTIEQRCEAKLLRAKTLSRLFCETSGDKDKPIMTHYNKALDLCLQIPQMLAVAKCSSEKAMKILSDAQAFVDDTQQLFEYRLPRLGQGQRLQAQILLAFKAGNFERVKEKASQYVARHKYSERYQRWWVSYLSAVADFMLYQASPTDDLKIQAEMALGAFVRHYQDKALFQNPVALIGQDLIQNANAYLAKLNTKISSNKIEKTEVIEINETGITPWHFNFDATVQETHQKLDWHPSLTVEEVKKTHATTRSPQVFGTQNCLYPRVETSKIGKPLNVFDVGAAL